MPRIRGIVLESAWSDSGINYEIIKYNLKSATLYGVKINGQETNFNSMDAVNDFLSERKIMTKAVIAAGKKKREEMLAEERMRAEVRKEIEVTDGNSNS